MTDFQCMQICETVFVFSYVIEYLVPRKDRADIWQIHLTSFTRIFRIQNMYIYYIYTREYVALYMHISAYEKRQLHIALVAFLKCTLWCPTGRSVLVLVSSRSLHGTDVSLNTFAPGVHFLRHNCQTTNHFKWQFSDYSSYFI